MSKPTIVELQQQIENLKAANAAECKKSKQLNQQLQQAQHQLVMAKSDAFDTQNDLNKQVRGLDQDMRIVMKGLGCTDMQQFQTKINELNKEQQNVRS